MTPSVEETSEAFPDPSSTINLTSVFLFRSRSWQQSLYCIWFIYMSASLLDSKFLKGTTWILVMNDDIFIILRDEGESGD